MIPSIPKEEIVESGKDKEDGKADPGKTKTL